MTLVEMAAAKSVKLGRKHLRNTWIHRLPVTGLVYDRVAGAMDVAETASFRGMTIAIARDDRTITPTLLTGDFERTEIDAFEALLGPGMTVIDVGANCGVLTALAAKHVGPTGRVISIEAVPSNAKLLANTVRHNKIDEIVTMVAKAASDTTAPLRIYLDGDNSGTHSVGKRTPQFVDVPATTVDALVSDLGSQRVDVVKIDVEGYEAQVFAGAFQTLSTFKPIVFAEFDSDMITAAGGSPDDVASTLAEHGSMYLIDERTEQITEIDRDVLVGHKESHRSPMACNVIVVPSSKANWFSSMVKVY